MRREFNPVVPDHILKSIVATQSSQPPLPRILFYLATHHIFHPKPLKCYILLPYVPEMFIDLILQECPLEFLERKIIQP